MPGLQTKTTTLFSLPAVKAWLNITGVDNSQDAVLVTMADAASEEIEQETSVTFVTRAKTLTFSGNGKTARALAARPIQSITSFTMDGTVVDPTTYGFDVETGILYFLQSPQQGYGPGFNCGVMNCVAVVQAGYDIQDGPSLPRDVTRAGLDLTKAIYDELKTGTIAATSVNLGGTSLVLKSAKRPPSVQRVIEKYATGWVLEGMLT